MQELNFEQMLDESMKEINVGDVLTGKVLRVDRDYIALSIGYKADGIVKKLDYTRDPNLDLTTVCKVGDELPVKVKKLNDGEGQVVLSVRELNQSIANDKLKARFESGEKQKGKVILVNKGGLSIEVEPGVTVFMPASLVSNTSVKDLNAYLNQELEFYITEFNPAKNRCIADRKKILVAEEKQKREEALSRIKEGDVIEGTVKSILDYGVFIDVGGIDGLLHITEIGWGKIKNPKKTFQIGDKVKVLVREIKNNNISLTCKFPDENPWLRAKVNYAIGKKVKGKVARMTEYGAFVALDEDIDALLHVSEIDRKRVKKPEDVLKIGQEIEAEVIDFNEVDHRISLSMKALLPEEEKDDNQEDVVSIDIDEYAKKLENESEN